MSSGSRRSDNTFLGYAIVLGALIALVVLITVVVDSGRSEQIPTVDYTPDALTLSEIAPYQAYAPDQDQLPEGWTPTSSRLNDGGALTEEEPTEPVRWSVGFATPEDRHAAFHISDAGVPPMRNWRPLRGRWNRRPPHRSDCGLPGLRARPASGTGGPVRVPALTARPL